MPADPSPGRAVQARSKRTTLPERRALETRARIVDAAYAVFARRGYDGASVDEVLTEADVSKGAFYHHVESKEALFRFLLTQRARQCTERMAEAIPEGASVAESVEAMLRSGWSVVTADPAWAGIQMEFWVQATRERWAQDAMSESFQQCQRFLSSAITFGQQGGRINRAIDAHMAARLILALTDGMMVQWRIQLKAFDPGVAAAPMAEMIARYLTCGGGNEAQAN